MEQVTEIEPSDYPQGFYHVYVDYAKYAACYHKPLFVNV